MSTTTNANETKTQNQQKKTSKTPPSPAQRLKTTSLRQILEMTGDEFVEMAKAYIADNDRGWEYVRCCMESNSDDSITIRGRRTTYILDGNNFLDQDILNESPEVLRETLGHMRDIIEDAHRSHNDYNALYDTYPNPCPYHCGEVIGNISYCYCGYDCDCGMECYAHSSDLMTRSCHQRVGWILPDIDWSDVNVFNIESSAYLGRVCRYEDLPQTQSDSDDQDEDEDEDEDGEVVTTSS